MERDGSGKQLRRTQSLSRFRLISVSAPNKMPPSHEHTSATLEDQDRAETLHGEMQRARVKSSRIEKRKLLLRKRMEELEKTTKITRHYS